MRGECLHIVGVGRGWDRGLPGLVGPGDEGGARTREGEKWDGKGKEVEARMKIAWRYQVGERGEWILSRCLFVLIFWKPASAAFNHTIVRRTHLGPSFRSCV